MLGGMRTKKKGLVEAAALEVVGKASSYPEKRIKTVEVGESLDLFDCGSSKPLSYEEEVQIPLKGVSMLRRRPRSLFAVFGLKFKYAEEHRSRKLYCTVTIDDVQNGGAQDIYNGFLPKPKPKKDEDEDEDDGFIELVLTGPNSFIAAYDVVFILVAIYDPEDPNWIRPPAPHYCGGRCKRVMEMPCGSYEMMRDITTEGLLIWTWNPDLLGYEEVFVHNLVYKGPPLERGTVLHTASPPDEEQLENPAGSKRLENPGSLILRCGSFEDAIFANEVKVEVKESLRNCVVMVTAEIMKEGCRFTEEEMLLFQNDENVKIFGKYASYFKNIKSKGIPREHLVPLELSRSSVTLPRFSYFLIVKVFLVDPLTKEVVEYYAQFCTRRSPCTDVIGGKDTVIRGDVVRGKDMAVTVFWEGWE